MSELKRTLTADYLEEIGAVRSYDAKSILAIDYGEEHRWYTTWDVTFRDPADGTAWRYVRCDDKTEMADLDWWYQYQDSNHIVCRRAAVRQILVDEWYDMVDV